MHFVHSFVLHHHFIHFCLYSLFPPNSSTTTHHPSPYPTSSPRPYPLNLTDAVDGPNSASLQRQAALVESLHDLPTYTRLALKTRDQMRSIAGKLKDKQHMFILGKGMFFGESLWLFLDVLRCLEYCGIYSDNNFILISWDVVV
jgi:hypothetical protein